MAARTIAQVSKVEGERVGTVAFLDHKTEVGLVPPTSPAYVLIVVNKLPLSQQHSVTKNNDPKELLKLVMSDAKISECAYGLRKEGVRLLLILI